VLRKDALAFLKHVLLVEKREAGGFESPIVAQGRISNQRYHSSPSMAKKPQSDYRLSLRKRWMERSVGAEIGGKARIFQARQRALPMSTTSLSPSLMGQFLEIECFQKWLGDAKKKKTIFYTIHH
jgi:hypothetical protein